MQQKIKSFRGRTIVELKKYINYDSGYKNYTMYRVETCLRFREIFYEYKNPDKTVFSKILEIRMNFTVFCTRFRTEIYIAQ